MFSLIACIGKNRELGAGGKLCFRLKEDMRFFKETTLGHKILMGRKTWETLPAGGLPGRENIVVSRNEVPGANWVVNDLKWFLEENAKLKEEIFVIGGGMVYFEALPYAQNLYLTEVDEGYEGADAWFPEFDKSAYDREVIKKGVENGVAYTIVKYTKK